jgi:hypothetical protein
VYHLYTINPPDPNIDPVAKPPSLKIHKSLNGSPLAVLKLNQLVKWVPDPPGTNAFNGLVDLIPPKYSSEFMNSSTKS